MAYENETIARAIEWDAARIRAAVLEVPVGEDVDTDLNDLLERFDGAVAEAADTPNRFGPAALDLCRFAAREQEPDLQTLAFYRALAAPASEDPRVASIAGSSLIFGLAISVVRQTYSARPDALAAREDFLAVAGRVQNDVGIHLGAEAFDWLFDVVAMASTHLSDTAANRMPLVAIETDTSLPSPLLAHRLYGDPQRAGELVDRNKAATPMFLPVRLEGLAG